MRINKRFLIGMGSLLLAVVFLFGIIFQAVSSIDLSAKAELSLSIASEDLSAADGIRLTIKDQRTNSELRNGNTTAQTTSSSVFEDALADSNQNQLKREWVMSLPEGITFDQTAADAYLESESGDSIDAAFTWNESDRELAISVSSEVSELPLLLLAEQAGDYQLRVAAEDQSIQSQQLSVQVTEATAKEEVLLALTGSKTGNVEPVADAKKAFSPTTMAFSTEGTMVSNWEEFATALADPAVTQITLANDIALSGTLSNYEGLFDKASVDLDSDYSYLFVSKAGVSRALVIDGNGFTFDFGNLAIGFTNASVNTSSYWNITMQNIHVKSQNYYAPFFYPVLAESTGITTSSYLSNSKLNYGENYKHTRYVATYEELNIGLATISVTNIQFLIDIVAPTGTISLTRRVANINNVAEQFSFYGSLSNNSGGYSWLYFNSRGSARSVVIDGDGYTWDQGSVSWCFRDPTVADTTADWDITMQNMTVYHGNYWGVAEFWDLSNTNQARAQIHYIDFVDYGSQLVESQRSTVTFAGNVHVEQLYKYTSVSKAGEVINTDWVVFRSQADNQTISVATAKIEDNANVYLSSIAGTTVHLREQGNLEIGENAQVELVRSGPGNPEANSQGYASVIDISSGSLTIKKGAHVKATSHHAERPTVLYMENSNSNLYVEEGAQLDVHVDSYSNSNNGATYNPIYMAGGTVLVNGTLNVNGEHMGASGTHLFYAQNAVSFEIGTKGTLNIISDSSSGSQYLMYLNNRSSTFKFSDAECVNLERTTALSSSNGLIYMANGGILQVSVQNIYQWLAGNVSADDTDWDYSYEPMSNMQLHYNQNVTSINAANSLYNNVLASFKSNFTTQNQQRVLFKRIPDPSVGIHSIANDNPDDPGSVTVYGYAIPDTYIRIWEEAQNGSPSAKTKGSNDTVVSPVEDTTVSEEFLNNFTVKSDVSGNWSYTLSSGSFTAGNILHVYGFSNLKHEEPTQVVLDKTAPTATGITYSIGREDILPEASKLVTNVADTSPINTGFDYAYTNPTEAEALSNVVGSHEVKINVSDQAVDADGNPDPNTAIITATLVVYDGAARVFGDDLEASYLDIREMTDSQLAAYIISHADPEAYYISGGVYTDLTSHIEVTDFGGLNDYDDLRPNTPYEITLTVPANSTTGLTTAISGKVHVTVIDMDAVLTVQFKDESGSVLSGYTITIGEDQDIDTVLHVGDTIDLQSSTYQAVYDQLTALETAGYEIGIHPSDERTLLITDTEQTFTYTVAGQLFLRSAPAAVDFGDLVYDTKVHRVDDPRIDADLVITDTRANKADGWTLSAALTKNLTNETGSVMNDALWYVNDNGDQISLTEDLGERVIYSNTAGGSFDVSNIWGGTATDPGLKLVADPLKTTGASSGTFSGVITWTIIAGQP